MTQVKQCSGCGTQLQTTQPKERGYAPNIDHKICQRCFRLKHYGDTSIIQYDRVSSNTVFEAINQLEGLVVLVSDITDIESGLFGSINRHLHKRDMILALTKTDLLPETVGIQKIQRSLSEKLKRENLNFKEVILIGKHGLEGREELIDALKQNKAQRYIFMGYANTGKSTLINALLNEETVTISRYPNTSLDVQSFQTSFGEIVDTPGIQIGNGFVQNLPFDRLDDYLWSKQPKIVHIQLKNNQAFILKGIGIVSIYPSETASVSLYFAKPELIHRTSLKNLDTYRKTQEIVFEPSQKRSFVPLKVDFDLVFKQIGWFSFRGSFDRIEVETSIISEVLVRKALI